jgi:hypothetical protein
MGDPHNVGAFYNPDRGGAKCPGILLASLKVKYCKKQFLLSKY